MIAKPGASEEELNEIAKDPESARKILQTSI